VRISLVMPTWNGARTLPEVLAALARQRLPLAEKVAVDSGSRDETVTLLAAAGFQVHSIPGREFDHGATRDLGISLTGGEIVVLLVQDALPAADSFLEALTAPFAADPRLAGCYGRQRPRPGANPILAERLRHWNASRGEPVIQEASEAELARLAPLERLHRCAFDNVASAVRRSAWEAAPFGRRAFGEDLAWARRVLLAGHRIRFDPAAEVIHSHDRSPMAEFRRLYCDHQNLRELFGLALIPTLAQALRARKNQARAYRELLAALPLGPREAAHWRRWARRYAWAEALGIWLGARSAGWRARRAPWFGPLDRWVRKGI